MANQKQNVLRQHQAQEKRNVSSLHREDRYLNALATDGVLAHATVQRNFRITVAAAEKLGVTITKPIPIEATGKHRENPPRTTRFHIHEDLNPKMLGHQLRHHAGAAALREALGAPADPDIWSLKGKAYAGKRSQAPDAVWTTAQGQIGIEFDAGIYDKKDVAGKMSAFRQLFEKQIWGAGTPARVAWLQKQAIEQGIQDVIILLVNWRDGTQSDVVIHQ